MFLFIFIYLIIMFIISFLFFFLSLLFGLSYFMWKETKIMFECGYECNLNSRMPFSLRFYMIIMMFLVFDMELILLFPLVLYFYMDSFYFNLICSSYVLFIILLGLFFEWSEGCLDWV